MKFREFGSVAERGASGEQAGSRQLDLPVAGLLDSALRVLGSDAAASSNYATASPDMGRPAQSDRVF
jgi:hypothetical protein